jgi:hypothetical protein
MSIILTEGFDLIGSNADLLGRGWTIAEAGVIAATANQYGGRAWDLGTTDDTVLALNMPVVIGTQPYISVACWRLYTTIPGTAAGSIIGIGDGVSPVTTLAPNSAHVYLQNAAGGGIRVSKANNTEVITLGSRIKANVWQHYELRVFVDHSVGTLEFWLDGILEVSETGIDTRDSGTTGNIHFTGNNDPSNCYIDDIVITQDATTEHAQIGLHRIHTLLPDGAGTNTAWTGSNTDVDDPFGASDGDTTFASESVVNDKQDYTFDNLSESPASVISVTVVTEARKDDSGTVGLTSFVLSNAVEGAGTEVGLSEAYSTSNDFFPLNPDGSVAWTETTVNALQAGHEITT